MHKVEKIDCRANGEVILAVRKLLPPDFYEMPYKEMASHSLQEQPLGGPSGDDDNHRKIRIFRIVVPSFLLWT
jgi:hypothetical protein